MSRPTEVKGGSAKSGSAKGERTLTERHNAHILYTWSAQSKGAALAIVKAEGAEFWTDDGTHWVDFESQVFNANLGHNDRRVVQAIQQQAATLCVAHPAAVFPAKVELGEALASLCPPGVDRFFFTNGGAEAVEHAVKIARMATGRHKIITRWRSYHGATYGALTLGGDPRRLPHEPGIPGVVRVEDPHCIHCPWGTHPDVCKRLCVDQLERVISYEGPDRIAAVLLEPIVGAAGGYIPPDDYLARVRKICDRHGILLIADEVFMGFGRSGAWFSHQHARDEAGQGVAPDLITMGKGITGGYAPLGAVAIRDSVADYFRDHTLWTGLTHYAHPLGCAAAVAAIAAYREDGLIERAAGELGEALAAELAGLAQDFEAVRHVRSRGAYGVFEIVDRHTGQPLVPFSATGAALAPMMPFRAKLRELGVHMAVKDHQVFVAPPLMTPLSVLQEGFGRIRDALRLIAA